MSIYKVERNVDTIIIEMDVSIAEKLVEVLSLVDDNTRMVRAYHGVSLGNLRVMLKEDAQVRYPSPLYSAEAHAGYVELNDAR